MLYTVGNLLSSSFQITMHQCAACAQCTFHGEFDLRHIYLWYIYTSSLNGTSQTLADANMQQMLS